ncbi:hypothetical protein [Sphingobium sp. MK2]|uniref:hypothetical protein n=1 Tax=Sphingobium sp. MK2 TaxID=3116540 RepID=UPI0032E362F5
MFSIPITLIYKGDEGVIDLPSSVNMDDIALVRKIVLDKVNQKSVESYYHLDMVPHTEIVLNDGRVIPIVERYDAIRMYLDTYRQIDADFSTMNVPSIASPSEPILRLIHGDKCATSQVSTPVSQGLSQS